MRLHESLLSTLPRPLTPGVLRYDPGILIAERMLTSIGTSNPAHSFFSWAEANGSVKGVVERKYLDCDDAGKRN